MSPQKERSAFNPAVKKEASLSSVDALPEAKTTPLSVLPRPLPEAPSPKLEPKPKETEPSGEACDPVPKARKARRTSKRVKAAPPFSLRLTMQERAFLEEKAGGRPLGAYIRERLLGEKAEQRILVRKPKVDEQQIAVVLAELGRSHLSSNLNQLAKSVNMGTLDASQDVEQELIEACGAVLAMRDALITALGLKVEDRGP